jgi:hypothetical protein
VGSHFNLRVGVAVVESASHFRPAIITRTLRKGISG